VAYCLTRFTGESVLTRTRDDFYLGTILRTEKKVGEDQKWMCQRPWVMGQPTELAAAKRVVERWSSVVFDRELAHAHAIYHDQHLQRKAAETARRAAEAERHRLQDEHDRATKPMLTLVHRTWDSQNSSDPYEVVIYGDAYRHGRVSIDVRRDLPNWQTNITPPPYAKVSWGGWGSTEPARAREFALAMLRAADEAEAFNRRQACAEPSQPSQPSSV
jgi:hypothetical protein